MVFLYFEARSLEQKFELKAWDKNLNSKLGNKNLNSKHVKKSELETRDENIYLNLGTKI